MSKKNIVIFYSETGGGHHSAARAIEAAISELISSGQVMSNSKVFIEDIFKKTHPIIHALVHIYNWFSNNYQTEIKYYNWFIDTVKPDKSGLTYMLASPGLFELLAKYDPKVIVSVHPMINRFLARAIREKWQDSKLIVVLTDPNAHLWKGWVSHDAELTIAPNDLAAKALVDLGLDSKSIITFGMPIHPAFLKPPSVSREAFLAKSGLSPNRLTIVMNSNGADCSRLIEVYQTLSKASKPVQCIFLAGHNEKLFKKLNMESTSSSVPVAILPFLELEDMANLMAICDVMITKAGGLTTYEALARRLPIAIDLLTKPMPQELGTAKLLIEAKLAWPLYKPEDILAIIQELEPGHRLQLPHIHQLDHIDAVYDIGRTIINVCDPAQNYS